MRIVFVLVMRVVHVRVFVLHCLVYVIVLMPLADVEPYAGAHQCRGNGQGNRRLFTKDD